MTTRYPIYIPSKGRSAPELALTAKMLLDDGVPFFLVVEPQEVDAYWPIVDHVIGQILELPFRDLGLGSIPARNWIFEHAVESGVERHWQLDDNIIEMRKLIRGQRIPCDAGTALAFCEDLSDSFENVAISGLNYQMFVTSETKKAAVANCHVYSCTLLRNDLPNRYRGRYNEDADICLQALADGYCTLLVNVFMANKMRTMVMTGGNTDELYADDGRLKMARSLERAWPGVVTVKRRFGRPQHVIDWKKFDTPLVPKPGVRTPKIADYGTLVAVKDVQSPRLRALLENENAPS